MRKRRACNVIKKASNNRRKNPSMKGSKYVNQNANIKCRTFKTENQNACNRRSTAFRKNTRMQN
jgi:hypothetical protein